MENRTMISLDQTLDKLRGITHEFSEGRYAGRADDDLHHSEVWVSSDTSQHPRTPVNLYLL